MYRKYLLQKIFCYTIKNVPTSSFNIFKMIATKYEKNLLFLERIYLLIIQNY